MLIGADTYGIIAGNYFPLFSISWFVFFVIKYFLYFIVVYEGARSLFGICVLAIIVCRFGMEFLTNLRKLKDPFVFMHYYNFIVILFKINSRVIELVGGAGFFIAFILGVFCNFYTVKGYAVLPFFVYMFLPVVSVVVPILLNSTLPYAIEVYEGTEKMLKGRATKLACSKHAERKFLVKRLRAMQPLAGFVGTGLFDYRFFMVKRSTRVTFYYVYVDYTITALLSVPTD